MYTRIASITAWGMWAAVIVGLAAVPWLDHLLRHAGRADLVQLTPQTIPPTIALVSAATVGAILASRKHNHPVGWLLLGLALSMVAAAGISQYLVWGLLVYPGSLPGARWVALGYPVVGVTALLLLAFVLLLTPTGSLPSPWLRPWTKALSILPPVVLMALLAFGHTGFDPRFLAIESPFDFAGFSGILLAIVQVALTISLLGLLVAAGSLSLRFRRATGVERQQLRWLAAVSVLISFVIVVSVIIQSVTDASLLMGWVLGVCLALVPLVIGAAILHYRLYDLDHIVSRTVSYAAITVLLATVYFVIVLGLSLISPLATDSPVVVAISTLVVAAAFAPVRQHIQRVVDRYFNHSRYNAAKVLDRFTAQSRDKVDMAELTSALIDAVDTAVAPQAAWVWFRDTRHRSG